MLRGLRPVAAALLVAAGCGGEEEPDWGTVRLSDSTTAPECTPHTIEAPTPPTAPAAPVWPTVTCPDGWSVEVVDDVRDIATCIPWARGEAECPDDQVRFPGGSCATLGSACPERWAPNLPSETRFVTSSTTASPGDGSRTAPFTSVQAAIDDAPGPATIALERGEHRTPPVGPIRLPAGFTLVGACARETTLIAERPTSSVVQVRLGAGVARIENLSIRATEIAIHLSGSPRTELVDVDVVAASLAGIWAEAPLDATRVRIRNVTGSPSAGIRVLGTEARLEDIVVERVEQHGIVAQGGGSIALRCGSLRALGDRPQATGLRASGGSTIDAREVIVERATDFGVLAREPGSAISASHLVVRDVGGTPRYGVGVIVEDGGRITLGDAYVEGAHARAIHVASCPEGATCTTASRLDAERLVAVAADPADPADAALSVVEAEVTLLSAALIGGATTALGLHHATLDAEDLFLLDVDTSGGVGLTAQLDSTATVTRALVAGRAKFGVVGLGAGTRVALTDVTIRDTRPDPATSSAGQGLQVSDATVVLTRAAFDGNFETGLAVGVGGRAELTDVRIDGTQPRAVDGRSGIGLVAIRGRVTARRLALRDNHAMGLVADGTALDAVDLAVERTRPEAATGSFGGGLQLANGATARIERAAVSGNRAFGMLIAGAGTRADLFATQVLDTASDDHGLFGHGVVADDGAIVTLTECRLNAQAQGGLVLAHGGAVAVNGVTLDDNEIGAVVFEGTLSPFDDVCLRSNQSDFAATVDVRIPNVFDAGGS